jgi:hypothetical protein
MFQDSNRGIFDVFDELQRLRVRVDSIRRESEVLRSRAVEHELQLIDNRIRLALGELTDRVAGH